MAELSQAAKDMAAGWFAFGKKSVVNSHEPHATVNANRAALDELIAAGLVTAEPFNKFGSMTYTGSDATWEIFKAKAQASDLWSA